MKFIINRTSAYEEKPCEEAFKESHVYVDRRTVSTLAEAKLSKYKHWVDEFFSHGTNYREEFGMIARDLDPQDIWVIEFNNLDELLKFNEKYGDVILGFENNYIGIERSIEIYDTYRE